jgi:hypothetical protein
MKILLKSTTKKQNPAKFVYDNFGSLTDKEIISYQAGDIIETAKDFANGDVYKAIELLKESLRVLGVNIESLENDEAKAHNNETGF